MIANAAVTADLDDPAAFAADAENTMNPRDMAAVGVSIFADVTDCLGSLRTMLAAMGSDLDTYANICGDGGKEGGDPRMALAECADQVRAALQSFLEPETLRALNDQSLAANKYIQSVARSAQTLSAVASLTRTTAASYSVTTMEAYLAELTEIASGSQEDAKAVRDRLRLMALCWTKTCESTQTALTFLNRMCGVLEETRPASDTLRDRELSAVRVIGKQAETLKNQGKAQLKGFVTAVQFADRLAQRLDHLSEILEYDDPHARRLAVAQIASIREAMQGTATATLAAMHEMAGIGKKGSDLFLASAVAETIQDSLAGRANVAERVASEMEGVEAAMQIMRSSVSASVAAGKEAEARFAQLESSAMQISMTAINAVLLAARTDAAREALSRLSAEVSLAAGQSLAAVGGCQTAMSRIGSQSYAAQDALLNKAEALTVVVLAYREEIEAGGKRLDSLRMLCSRASARIDEMLSMVARVRDGMTRVSALGQTLESFASGLDLDSGSATVPDAELLTRIWGIYTMDEERSVHANVFSDLGIEPPTAPPTDSDDIDDLFF
jgi:hypothetical protein